jgi:hypothetical protein
VAAFEKAHELGVEANALLDPKAAIFADPPDVWLTSYYGFQPRNWGFLGFTLEKWRERFLRESRPGALVVIYAGGGRAAHDIRGKIIGIQQITHRIGRARQFMASSEWDKKEADPDRRGKWEYAVQVVAAWAVTPETAPYVATFAPDSYRPELGRFIGAQGVRLTAREARGILELDLEQVEVFGGQPIEGSWPAPAAEILKPSRAGAVSQSPYTVREAEGPKHLYILELKGDTDAFLGKQTKGRRIVKVGMSRSPESRCRALNSALPRGTYCWRVLRSTWSEGRDPFPSSRHAIAGEDEMKRLLFEHGCSLGGEFFLSTDVDLHFAWERGIAVAAAWTAA